MKQKQACVQRKKLLEGYVKRRHFRSNMRGKNERKSKSN